MSKPADKKGQPGQEADTRLLVPFEQMEDRKYEWALLFRLAPYASRYLSIFVLASVLMMLAAALAPVQPFLIKYAVDAAIVDHDSAELMKIVAYFAGAIVALFIARFGALYWMQLAGQKSVAALRREVFLKIQRLPTSYFDRTPVGKIVTRVTNDVDALSELFASGAVTAIADVLTVVFNVGFMLYLDWRLTLLTLVAMPPVYAAVSLIRRLAREAFRSIRLFISQLNAYLSEQVQGVAVVQAFSKEKLTEAEYDEINSAYRDANYRAIRYDALLYSVVSSISATTIGILLWYAAVEAGGLSAAESAAYVGTVVAFYEYTNRFFEPIRDLSQKVTVVQSSIAAAERIFGIMEIEEEDAPEGRSRPSSGGPVVEDGSALAFRDVRFSYREGVPILKGISFSVKEGETVAIVGATGAGKSTVIHLLLRLYEIGEGSVTLDGRDIRDMKRAELRALFSTVSQDVFLFSGSILANVACGDPEPDAERAMEALKAVGAESLLEGREGGLEAKVAERGANFSAGERQLLAFARALYQDRKFLILDEATANVDSETEARLQSAVDTLFAGRTSVVIAHRLSTIRKADRILVFHHGEIVERGKHEELLAQEGVYARLHRLHFAEEEERISQVS